MMTLERGWAVSMKDQPRAIMTVSLLRSMFKNLKQFRVLREDIGLDVISSPDGCKWSIWDLEALYDASQTMLSDRQAQAIRMFLVDGMFEADCAELMGVSRTNPIGMYATNGLERIVMLINDRLIRGYQNGD